MATRARVLLVVEVFAFPLFSCLVKSGSFARVGHTRMCYFEHLKMQC